ncbi:MAG: hypothetical protein KKB02_14100 [Alphaproteobacteria bacterium]|nr:hypothetical protein [Alphaproteobacteria bacterium]
MADDGFLHYVFVSAIRAVLGRRTVGLLFRPRPVIDRLSFVQKLKFIILKILRHNPRIQTLTIVPFSLNSSFSSIADGWIHDFQLWDIAESDRFLVSALRNTGKCEDRDMQRMYEQIKLKADGMPILISLGAQNIDKGFRILAEAYGSGQTNGWSVVAAGRIAAGLESQQRSLSTGANNTVIPSMISDRELLAAYAAADAVWCFYDPSYDQASGILGRAVQFGLPVIVREGSMSHMLCTDEHLAHVAASDASDVGRALSALSNLEVEISEPNGRALSKRLKVENVDRLYTALLGRN